MIAAAVQAALQSRGPQDDLGDRPSRRSLDERFFRRVKAFSGGEAEWKDWAFQFRAAIRGANRAAARILEWVERAAETVSQEDVETQFVEEDVEKLNAELYDVLCTVVEGEPLTIVRGVTSMSGFVAWRKLYGRYNPTTPARALAAMMDVMNIRKVTDVCRIPQAIDEWDLKVQTLSREFREDLSERMKVALMLSMVPPDLQDLMYQQAATMKDFSDAKAVLKGIVQNRIARNLPTPMDIGKVGDGEDEVGVVSKGKGKSKGKGSCLKCGKSGHFARECLKGKGKGYQGTCFTCGEFGHPARECPSATGGKSAGKGESKGKGANWWGKGVWQVDGDVEEADWQWDQSDDDAGGGWALWI